MVLLATLLLGSAARADEEANSKARALYSKGIAHQKAGRQEQACASFSEAFSMRRHYQIAANLGNCELQLKRHRKAAGHLHFAAVEMGKDPEAGPEQIEPIAKLLREAQAELITISVEVQLGGAKRADYSLLIDGKPVEVNADTAYAEPGSHVLRARTADAASAPAAIDGTKGSQRSAKLDLRPSAAVPTTTKEGGGGTTQMTTRAAWPTVVLLSASLAAVVGVAIATPLMVGANSDATDLADEIELATKQSPHIYCAVVVESLQQQCTDWRDARRDRTNARAAMIGSAVGAGLGLVAAAVYQWAPSRGPEAAAAAGRTRLVFGASATPNGGGLLLRGRF